MSNYATRQPSILPTFTARALAMNGDSYAARNTHRIRR
jgi:hypothetical protein